MLNFDQIIFCVIICIKSTNFKSHKSTFKSNYDKLFIITIISEEIVYLSIFMSLSYCYLFSHYFLSFYNCRTLVFTFQNSSKFFSLDRRVYLVYNSHYVKKPLYLYDTMWLGHSEHVPAFLQL